MEIDFEFSSIEFKNNNGSEIGFEIKNIFNFNSNAGKLNKKLYLISRLYTAISVLKKYLRRSFRVDSRSDFVNTERGRFHYIKD
jgi:hypothetical protein